MGGSRWLMSIWLAALLPLAARDQPLAHAHHSASGASRPLLRPWAVFAAALLVRCAHALLVQTAFNPDEYWQSLEVAHNVVFGPGFITWEWQPHARIRGFAHPALFVAFYWVLRVTGLDRVPSLGPWLVAVGPRLMQAVMAAACDLCAARLAARLFGTRVARWALLAQWSSWFLGFCLVRTFSNSVEATLTVAAFAYWPWRGAISSSSSTSVSSSTVSSSLSSSASSSLSPHTSSSSSSASSSSSSSSRFVALALAAAAFVFRPTSALPWALLGIHQLFTCADPMRLVFAQVVPIAMVAVVGGALIDFCFYGRWVFVPWAFVQFNSVFGVSALYGTHPMHWYLTEGWPVMLLGFAPLCALGVHRSGHLKWLSPAWMMIVATVAYSGNVHKEYRFLLPMVPVALVYAAVPLAQWFDDASGDEDESQVEFDSQSSVGSSVQSSTTMSGGDVETPSLSQTSIRRAAAAAASTTTKSNLPSLSSSPISSAVSSSAASSSSPFSRLPRSRRLIVAWLVFLPQLVVFAYLALFHQRAPLSVIHFVREHSSQILSAPDAFGMVKVDVQTAPLLCAHPRPWSPGLITATTTKEHSGMTETVELRSPSTDSSLSASASASSASSAACVGGGISPTILNSFLSHNPDLVPLPSSSSSASSASSAASSASSSSSQIPSSSSAAFPPPPSFVHRRTHRPFAVHFLTSCHATPFYSHVHHADRERHFTPMRQLDCAPKLFGTSFLRGPCVSETTCFLSDPAAFLEAFYVDPASASESSSSFASAPVAVTQSTSTTPSSSSSSSSSSADDAAIRSREGGDGRPTRAVLAALIALSSSLSSFSSSDATAPTFLRREWLPTHVVMFNQQASLSAPWLEAKGYRQIASFFHAPFGDELEMIVFSCVA